MGYIQIYKSISVISPGKKLNEKIINIVINIDCIKRRIIQQENEIKWIFKIKNSTKDVKSRKICVYFT